jgi:hypothetical protein
MHHWMEQAGKITVEGVDSVNTMDIRKYAKTHLEHRIRSLVLVMRNLGIQTTASCHGHRRDGRRIPAGHNNKAWVAITVESFNRFYPMLERCMMECEIVINIQLHRMVDIALRPVIVMERDDIKHVTTWFRRQAKGM